MNEPSPQNPKNHGYLGSLTTVYNISFVNILNPRLKVTSKTDYYSAS